MHISSFTKTPRAFWCGTLRITALVTRKKDKCVWKGSTSQLAADDQRRAHEESAEKAAGLESGWALGRRAS